MKHLVALFVKLVMVFLVLYVILGLFLGLSFGNVLTLSLLLTVTAYLIGDLVVLPLWGNLIATVADFGLALVGIWFISYYILEASIPMVTGVLTSAVLIAFGEWFFHKYLSGRVIDNKTRT